MKLKFVLLIIPLLSAATHAGYVDYRHEYYDDGRNYDRVYMSHRFATGFGVAVEAISRSDDAQSNDAWNNMESNGNEYTASYQFTWQDLIWQPGIAIETGDNIAIYKPYIRVQYNINDSWWTAFRYAIAWSTCAETAMVKMTAWSTVLKHGLVITSITGCLNSTGFIRLPIAKICITTKKKITNITFALLIT